MAEGPNCQTRKVGAYQDRAKRFHHLLVADAPVWLTEEVEKWFRAFFWAGKNEMNAGQCLVAWDKICKPQRYGGLGIKNLLLQGLALRSRWEWFHGKVCQC